jgi:hypothetical protein
LGQASDFRKRAAFQVPKPRLALLGEQLGNGQTRRLLNPLVKVVKRQSQPLSDPLADSGFAAAHVADEIQVAHRASLVYRFRWAEPLQGDITWRGDPTGRPF